MQGNIVIQTQPNIIYQQYVPKFDCFKNKYYNLIFIFKFEFKAIIQLL